MSFGFESPSDDHHSLLIYFREDTDVPEREIVDHPIPISVRNPINPEDWLIDSVKALAIAQDNGLNKSMAKYDSETASLFLALEERRPIVPGALLQWRASYLDLGTLEGIDVMLDPQTGEVIEVERQ